MQEGGQRAAVPKVGGSSNSGSGGGDKNPLPKADGKGGTAQVRVRYVAHLPSLSLWDGEKLQSILEREVLPTLQSHFICKN